MTEREMKQFRRALYQQVKNQEFVDLTLVVGERTIMAQKTIMAASSDVFKAMLAVDMVEKQTNQVVIDDLDYKIVKAMVRYIYLQEMKKDLDEEILFGLLEAAEKYNVIGLKDDCQRKLGMKLTRANVIKYFQISEKYCAQLLLKKCADYIFAHGLEILETDEWKNLDAKSVRIICEAKLGAIPFLRQAVMENDLIAGENYE